MKSIALVGSVLLAATASAVSLTDGGKTVKFGANRGLMLIVR